MIDVVIVNWNAGPRLKDCVCSVIDNSSEQVTKIIVVDNGSVDGSLALIGSMRGVTIIRANENLGFGKACNLGAAQSDSKFILFLNPDAGVYEDTLSGALRYMNSPENSKVGICGVGLIDEKNHLARSCARFPTAFRFSASAAGITKLLPSLGTTMLEWDHGETRFVDQVIGAFFLIRRSVFSDLKGFDERFFVYFEEVDISLRASLAGWKSVYLSNLKAFHAGGGTSNQVKAKRLFYSLRSRLLYAQKHFSRFDVFVVFFFTFLVESISRSIFSAAKFSFVSVKETMSAYAMLIKWMRQRI